MKKAIFVCFLLSLVLCGCGAPIKTVEEPASGERARLRVISDRGVYIIPGHCADLTRPGAGTVSEFKGRSLGMPAGPTQIEKGDAAELYVKAGSPITLGVRYMSSHRDCIIVASFVPKANQDYEAVTEGNPSECSLKMWKIGKENVLVPLTKVPYGSSCW